MMLEDVEPRRRDAAARGSGFPGYPGLARSSGSSDISLADEYEAQYALHDVLPSVPLYAAPLELGVTSLRSRGRHVGYSVDMYLGHSQRVRMWPDDRFGEDQSIPTIAFGALAAADSDAELQGKPSQTLGLFGWSVIGYKLVAKVGQRYFSLWAGVDFEYELGVTSRECATPHLSGGLYVCSTPRAALRMAVMPIGKGFRDAPHVVLLCVCSGPFVQYNSSKASCTCLTPIKEVPLPSRGPLSRPSDKSIRTPVSASGKKVLPTLPGWPVVGFAVASRSDSELIARHAECSVRVRSSPTFGQVGLTRPDPFFMLWCICWPPFVETRSGGVRCSSLEVLGKGLIPEVGEGSAGSPRLVRHEFDDILSTAQTSSHELKDFVSDLPLGAYK